MENDGGEEVVGESKMAAATALTNGHVNDVGSSPDDSVITKSVPKVTESFKSSEQIGENSSDVERFKSKLTESSEKVGDSVRDVKQYEENALKAMSERSDNAEMSSTTETRLGQVDLVETSDSGVVKSQYREDQEKKHETASKTSEEVGDMSSSKELSEKSHQRSSVTVDASSDGSHGVLVDVGNDTSSQSFEEIKGDGFRGSRKVENSRSERQLEYTSEGGSSGAGKLEFAKQMDELFDPRGEYTKKDRDKRSVNFLDEFGEMERSQGNASSRALLDDHDGYTSRRRGYGGEMDHYSGESYSSSSSSRLSSRSSSRKENSLDEGGDDYNMTWGLSTDRRTADDLIKRILAESRGKPVPPRSPVARVQEEERPFSPSARYSPSSPRYDPIDDRPSSSGALMNDDEPHTPTSPKKELFKVDMGGGAQKRNVVDMTLAMEDDDEDEQMVSGSTVSSSSSQRRMESYNEDQLTSHEGNMVVAMPKNKPQPQEEMSLLDRRLASMGFNTKLGQEIHVDKETGGHEGYVETTYISRTKPPGFVADDDDDLDKEISAMRSSYREGQERRTRYLRDDYDYDDEPMPVARQSMESSYLSSRGRMVRQDYVEGGDAFNYGAPPPPPHLRPAPEDGEDFIPDEEFVPKKRPETEEVVKEKTTNIRSMVENQTSALEKLREASNSFDELNNEIRSIKQQFMENQMKRTNLMTDDFEQPDDVYPPIRRGGGHDRGYGGAGRGANQYDPGLEGLCDDYKPYIPRRQRMAMQRSRSLYDDAPYMDAEGRGDGPQGPMDAGAGPDGTGRYEPMEEEGEEDDLGYGRQPPRKPAYDFERKPAYDFERKPAYDFERKPAYDFDREERVPQRRGLDFDYEAADQPAPQRRGYDFESDQPPPRRKYEYESDPQKKSYESYESGYSSTAARYLSSRPTFARANTVSDFNFDRPSSPTFVRNDRYDRPSTFSSRFLDKVREKKHFGSDASVASSRDKPFKSRFLRDSFTASTSSSTSSSFTSSRSSRTSAGGASSDVGASIGGGASSNSASDAPTQDKIEAAPTDGAAATEAASTE